MHPLIFSLLHPTIQHALMSQGIHPIGTPQGVRPAAPGWSNASVLGQAQAPNPFLGMPPASVMASPLPFASPSTSPVINSGHQLSNLGGMFGLNTAFGQNMLNRPIWNMMTGNTQPGFQFPGGNANQSNGWQPNPSQGKP